jgi:hypothetical protein
VADQPLVVLDAQPAEDEREVGAEAVGVVSDADAHG